MNSAFRVYNQLSVRKKIVCNLYSCLQISSGISTQVENKLFHSLTLQLIECIEVFIIRMLCEMRNLYVNEKIRQHITCINTVNRNFAAGDGIINQLRITMSKNTDIYFTSFRPAQHCGDLCVCDMNACNIPSIYFHNSVSALNT